MLSIFNVFHTFSSTECDDCDKLYKGDCPIHGPLLWVKDSAVRSRARASLPNGLYFMPSALAQGGLGVFAKNGIERRVIFGPFEGQIIPFEGLIKGMDKSYMWDVSSFLCPTSLVGLQRYTGVPVHRYMFCHDTNIVY